MIRPYRDRSPAKFFARRTDAGSKRFVSKQPRIVRGFPFLLHRRPQPGRTETTLTVRTKHDMGDCKHTLRWLASGRGLCDGNIMMMQAAGGDRRGLSSVGGLIAVPVVHESRASTEHGEAGDRGSRNRRTQAHRR